ncbi:MAG: B12-binding domain-containing radical SAM protein [Planctomycetia bacterium]
MARIILINPKFDASYWGFEHALPIVGKRSNLPTACLPLLAALTPREHHVTLIDENVEPIDFAMVQRADIVGLTGMSVQRRRMKEILRELTSRGVFCVVGGPWVTVQEDYFGTLADVIFVGEAEDTWPQFLREWEAGAHQPRYEQSERTDMTRVPVPRYDLLQMRHYLFGSVQFSRGCPFQCEFCDIIVTFGRRPRLKTSRQILAELDALRANRMEIVFVVDDNLIGNKAAIKEVLQCIAAWQHEHGFPITFFAEASVDLADDPELMRLMTEANFTSVFVGIETPNEAALRETKKLQNVRAGGTLVEKVHAIQAAGLEVWCGLIVGFDSDDRGIFDRQQEFVEQTRISHAMMGMLSAIPKTPLYERLAREGRLDPEEESPYGTNVLPLGMSREDLRNGYIDLQHRLHEPEAYFDRLDRLFLDARFQFAQPRAAYLRRRPLQRLRADTIDACRALGAFTRLMLTVHDPTLRRVYGRRFWQMLRERHEPQVWMVYAIKCVIHYHHYTMSRQMTPEATRLVNTF